jgi:hypothetical protein
VVARNASSSTGLLSLRLREFDDTRTQYGIETEGDCYPDRVRNMVNGILRVCHNSETVVDFERPYSRECHGCGQDSLVSQRRPEIQEHEVECK